MPVLVTQGRYSQSAVKAMLAQSEDRGGAVAKLTGGPAARVLRAKTMLAMITVEAKAAFEAAQNLAAVYRPPGAA